MFVEQTIQDKPNTLDRDILGPRPKVRALEIAMLVLASTSNNHTNQ